jgi:hypothetical protein
MRFFFLVDGVRIDEVIRAKRKVKITMIPKKASDKT